MKRLVALFVVGLLSLGARADDRSPAPFLWQVQHGGTTHYLLGSVHLLPESAHPLPAALEKAYAASRALYFETDIDALQSPAIQQQLLASAMGNGLKSEVSDALLAQVHAHARQLGLPETICDLFRAWFCAMSFEVARFTADGFDAAQGIDQTFYARAKADRKPVNWLETPANHVQIFTRMSDELGVSFLRATMDDDASPEAQPKALYHAWLHGDDGFVEKLVLKTRDQYPALYHLLLADRNARWLPRLEALFRETEPQLVIVGAAHLYGPDGLIAELNQRGFRVRGVASLTPR